ncbi:MAG TPA: GT4 family glycosyltransferase PelF [Micromonosporaceae bacterium]|nr:GT4 family glycosyltransferase PelF [Micromonosporaceae bacterium]
MRLALINEGTYPFVTGGVSTWCHQLVTGLHRHRFHLVAVTGAGSAAPVYAAPNVTGLTSVPVWDRALAPRRPAARRRRRATEAAALLCRGLLTEGRYAAGMFATGLRRLAEISTDGGHPLHGVPVADVLCDAWRVAGRQSTARLTLRAAQSAGSLLEHALRALVAAPPTVDICHAVATGLPALVALATKWRTGTPFVLTEHGVYLRERYLEYSGTLPVPVKAVMTGFYRAVARISYAEAAAVTSVSDFNRGWQLRCGADPAKLFVVPNGVDPDRFPALPSEPAEPTVVWVGRVDPLKDLHTLIEAFQHVYAATPAARLRLVGPVPRGNEEYAAGCRELAGRLGMGGAVAFAGPVGHSREAFATGHVVALSSISEGMPYTVVEAMMCGRATVSTDVGAVAETAGDTGLVVPPRDPTALGAACLELLRNPNRRRSMAASARDRALAHFTLDRMLGAYAHLYADAFS